MQDWYNNNKRPTAAFWNELEDYEKDNWNIKIATARCARISYTTLGDNPKIDYEADIKLHDMLLKSKHFSPFEHVARAMSSDEYYSFFNGENNIINEDYLNIYTDNSKLNNGFGWCRNFKEFIQYRALIDN